jgi:hypothetical protein
MPPAERLRMTRRSFDSTALRSGAADSPRSMSALTMAMTAAVTEPGERTEAE